MEWLLLWNGGMRPGVEGTVAHKVRSYMGWRRLLRGWGCLVVPALVWLPTQVPMAIVAVDPCAVVDTLRFRLAAARTLPRGEIRVSASVQALVRVSDADQDGAEGQWDAAGRVSHS